MPFNILAPSVTLRVKKEKKIKTKGIDKAADLTGIEVRLLPPFIADNQTQPFLFFKGYSKLYCVVIVVSDANNQLVGGIDLQGFPRIGDKEFLPINKTIFYWQQDKTDDKPPTQVHTMISVIKSKKGLRKAGQIMTELGNDTAYKSVVAKLAANSTPVGAVANIVTELGALVGKYLGQVEDKPIATIVNSYTSLYGDFDKIGIKTVKYDTPNVNFSCDVIVRDKASDAAAALPVSKSTGPLLTKGAAKKSGKKSATKAYTDQDTKVLVDLKTVK